MPQPDHLLLRSYHVARRQGDELKAAQLWDELLTNNLDRLRMKVKLFRFDGTTTPLPKDEHGSAVSEVYIRARAMGGDFKKTEPEALYAALHQVVFNTCMDLGRKELRHAQKAEGSFDERYDGSEDAGPYDQALADYAKDREQRSKDALEAEASKQQAEQLVAWGIAKVKNEQHRAVLELTWTEKLDGKEIAERLNLTPANVYQCRRRGNQELERILRGL